MTQLTLYGVPVSAFVAKVRVVLDMKGVAYDEVAPPGGYGSPEYRALVPAGSVPGLMTPEGPLHDSTAIIEWLEETHPAPRLTPDDPFARARMRALIGFHDTRLEAAARQAFAPIKAGWRDDPRARTAQEAITGALTRLEELIDPAPYLGGEAPNLADCAYPATLQMAWMILDEIEAPRPATPKIDAWVATLRTQPAIARSLTIAGDAMEAWMAQFRT